MRGVLSSNVEHATSKHCCQDQDWDAQAGTTNTVMKQGNGGLFEHTSV